MSKITLPIYSQNDPAPKLLDNLLDHIAARKYTTLLQRSQMILRSGWIP